VSRRVWIAKVGLVLLMDVALAATGVGLIVASRSRRADPPAKAQAVAPGPAAPAPSPPTVEVARPKVVRKGRRSPSKPAPPGAIATPSLPTPVTTPPATTPPAPDPVAAQPTDPGHPAETGPGAPADPPPADPGPPPAEPIALPSAPADAAPPPPDDGRADRIADSIREVVEDHRGQIDRCYERVAKAATRTEPLRGTVTVSLSLQPSGNAADVRVAENDTGSDDLGACLVALLESWRFPSPGEESIEFLWPFVFRGK